MVRPSEERIAPTVAAHRLGSRRRTRRSYPGLPRSGRSLLATGRLRSPADAGTKRVRERGHERASSSTARAVKRRDLQREHALACPQVDARPSLVLPCREGVSEPPGLRLRCQLRRSRAKHHDCQFPPCVSPVRRSRAALCIRAGGSEVLRTGSEIECGARLRHPGPENSRSRAGGARGQFRPERRARRRSAARCRASENRGRTGPWP